MEFHSIYKIGKIITLPVSNKKIDDKLSFVYFPYRTKDIFSTGIILFFAVLFFGALTGTLFGALNLMLFISIFFGILVLIIIYVYPVHIFYTHSIMEYKEEMLRSIMRLSIFILMKTSMEYAIEETTKTITGILHNQFNDIITQLKRRKKYTLGAMVEYYAPIWNDINPVYVKSLRMLETAMMSQEEDTQEIVSEAIGDILRTYNTLQKRYSEDLSAKAKKLVAFGVLFPIMLLMLLPMVSVFMPDILNIGVLIFFFNIFIPTLMLIFALDFSTQRIQVDTIRINESPDFKKMPTWVGMTSIAIFVFFSIPTIVYLNGIDYTHPSLEQYGFYSLFMTWLIVAGIVLGVYFYTRYYKGKYAKLWDKVYETEQDLPHLLQVFSTYLSMNISVENIFREIISDYELHGFGKHPVVALFKSLNHLLLVSKQTVTKLVSNVLPKLCPSRKVTHILAQVISFSTLDLKGAGKAAKMMRNQQVSLYKLNDYIQTLLADTVSLINMTLTMLLPLLAAVSVIMSAAIVYFIDFLTKQLQIIASIGGSSAIDLQLIDVSKIIPPSIVSIIVGLYLVETILVLSIFESNIKIGYDKYQMISKISRSILGFFVYSIILFGGYYVFRSIFFEQILGGF